MVSTLIYKIHRKIRNVFLHYAFWFLDKITPTDNNLFVFSQSGDLYTDNGKALFEYGCSDSRVTCIWLANSKAVKDRITSSVGEANVVYKYSLKGLGAAFRAKVFVATHGSGDLYPYTQPSKNKIVLMLWHAITVKQYSFMDNGLTHSQRKEHLKKESSFFNTMISSSHIDRLANSACYKIPAHNVYVTGLPRNDFLFRKEDNKSVKLPLSIEAKLLKTAVLYAPTFRDNGKEMIFFPFKDLDIHQVRAFLEKHDVYLFIRPHKNDTENMKKIHKWRDQLGERLVIASSDIIPNVSDILKYIDVIITDYSSIYIDLLLRDVPPVFIPYDREEYEQERGIIYDYDLITPGPKVESMSEFINGLESAIERAPEYALKRKTVKKMFHYYEDQFSSKRVIEMLIRLIESER